MASLETRLQKIEATVKPQVGKWLYESLSHQHQDLPSFVAACVNLSDNELTQIYVYLMNKIGWPSEEDMRRTIEAQ